MFRALIRHIKFFKDTRKSICWSLNKLNTGNEMTLMTNHRTSDYIEFKVNYIPKIYSLFLTGP